MTISEVIKDGITYIREVHENGAITEHVKPSPDDLIPPEPRPPEPTQEELNNLALMEGIAGLYESQIALENRMVTDNLTVMEGIAGLFEAQMGGR